METSGEQAALAALVRDYHSRLVRPDEAVDVRGNLAPHWNDLFEFLAGLPTAVLDERREFAERIVRENTFLHHVHAHAGSRARERSVDLIPLLISSSEWSRIEAATAQRAALLNAILADIYGGAQHLLRDGFIPSGVIYANPAFLRPLHGVKVPHDVYIHLVAFDLVRNRDGEWHFLASRTHAPAGLGYTLENRSILSRSLPEILTHAAVQPLGKFFANLNRTLTTIQPSAGSAEATVLLTPGPQDPEYLEHSYLARALGCTLAEGADLTVRKRRLYLKTLEGLQPVSLMVRRVEDGLCDPLEFPGDSFVGVPGLVDAIRSGSLSAANALGASLAECGALHPFLPALSRHLLGEDLLLSSVETLWCGDAGQLAQTLETLNERVVKPAFRTGRARSVHVNSLPVRDRERLVREIRERPMEFIAQETPSPAGAPSMVGRDLESRRFVLRVFAVAAGGSWMVLPGGVVRATADTGEVPPTNAYASATKDVWVIGKGTPAQEWPPIHLHSNTPVGPAVPVSMPSRVADNLFWLARYMERTENMVRLLRAVLGRLSGEKSRLVRMQLDALNEAIRALYFPASAKVTPLEKTTETLLHAGGFPDSIFSNVQRVQAIAGSVREWLSLDTSRIIAQMDAPEQRPASLPMSVALEDLNTLLLQLAAFSGMEMENMTRGLGWRFLDLGRRVERAGNTSAWIVRALNDERAGHEGLLEPLLEIADSSMTYRRRYLSGVSIPGVVSLLGFDETNPRSYRFQVDAIAVHHHALPSRSDGALAALQALLSDIERLPALAWDASPRQVREWRAQASTTFSEAETHLQNYSNAISERFFSHADSGHQVVL